MEKASYYHVQACVHSLENYFRYAGELNKTDSLCYMLPQIATHFSVHGDECECTSILLKYTVHKFIRVLTCYARVYMYSDVLFKNKIKSILYMQTY